MVLMASGLLFHTPFAAVTSGESIVINPAWERYTVGSIQKELARVLMAVFLCHAVLRLSSEEHTATSGYGAEQVMLAKKKPETRKIRSVSRRLEQGG